MDKENELRLLTQELAEAKKLCGHWIHTAELQQRVVEEQRWAVRHCLRLLENQEQPLPLVGGRLALALETTPDAQGRLQETLALAELEDCLPLQ